MHKTDMDKLLATRYDNGADFWATPDGRIGIEKPISTLTALLIMSELNVEKSHEALQGAAELVLHAISSDGRVRISPKGSIYPCHMALAAAALCRNGYADDQRVKEVLAYLLSNRFEDGGWRCNKFLFGRGPETNFSNPGVTLIALDAFRCAGMKEGTLNLDHAVETLLNHWTVRVPIGPCHFGMGTLFMQVEYPFLRYNLFYYVYVLSFYSKARKDERFIEAFETLSKKLDSNHRLIVERPNRKLDKLDICRKGEPSEAATKRYLEIVRNMKQNNIPKSWLVCSNLKEWHDWLVSQHDMESEVWLQIKKANSLECGIRLNEAVEEALCFGWIDGKMHSLDSDKFILRFTPRKPGSLWSLINRNRAEALIANGRMTEAGMVAVREAQANGRWQAAYSSKKVKDL